MLDSGTLLIYNTTDNGERGSFPVVALELKAEECFEKKTVSLTRFYSARQANVNVDMVARIWRNETISTQDVASIDNEYFRIRQVQHATDKDEMPVTDLSLERTAERFDVRTI